MSALRAGQVAEAAQVNVESLRYYERRGLLPKADRTLGGQRLYPAETITRLRVIKTAQRLGFTLTEIAELLDAGIHRHHRGTEPGLQPRVRDKLAKVESRITDLQVIRQSLQAAIAAECTDLMTCAGSLSCPLPFTDLIHARHTGEPHTEVAEQRISRPPEER